MLGDGGTDSKYLGSGDEDGLASMDLGTSTTVAAGFRASCGGSASWVLPGRAAAEVMTVVAALCAVLGSRPDMVTVVSTVPPQEAGQEGPSRAQCSGEPSPGAPGKYLLSERAWATLSGSSSEVFSGRLSGTASPAELRAGSQAELSCLGLDSSFLAGADDFCLFGAGSSSDDGT